MTSIKHSFTLERSTQVPLYCDLRSTAPHEAQPLIIVLHGFRTHKDWSFFPIVCEQLAESGAHVLNFNFSLNGYSHARQSNTEPPQFNIDEFAANTIRQELQDARDVLSAWIDESIAKMLTLEMQWDGRVFLLGHSRGAGIALLLSECNALIQRLCLWSPIKSFDRSTARQKALWREQGVLDMAQSNSGPAFSMNLSFLLDLEQHQQEYALTRAVERCQIPLCCIVGEQDLVTRPAEAKELLNYYKGPSAELHVLARCGHSFHCNEPFTNTSACLAEAIQLTQRSFALQVGSRT